jgi:DNA repair ATPase RecN
MDHDAMATKVRALEGRLNEVGQVVEQFRDLHAQIESFVEELKPVVEQLQPILADIKSLAERAGALEQRVGAIESGADSATLSGNADPNPQG